MTDIFNDIAGFGGTLLYTLPPFLFVLAVVVFVHEFGHFQVARWFNTRIDSFSIGFGPEIFGWNGRRGTRWKVCWIPLGGYVKFHGDMGAASVPDREALERMRAEDKDVGSLFHFKPVWQRAAVVAAGPFANFFLAIGIFALLVLFIGERVLSPKVDAVVPGSPAEVAGFQPGDLILEIDGRKIDSFEELQHIVALNLASELNVVVLRDGDQRVTLMVRPELQEATDPLGRPGSMRRIGIERKLPALIGNVLPDSAAGQAGLEPDDLVVEIDGTRIDSFNSLLEIVRASPDKALTFVVLREGQGEVSLEVIPKGTEERDEAGDVRIVGKLGITQGTSTEDVRIIRYGPVGAVGYGVERTWDLITGTLSYVAGIFVGTQSADQVGGPIRIAQMSGQIASFGITALISFIAVISVSIGLINLFPIPILDGGHLLFYAYEAIVGQPLSEKAQEVGFRIGLALVLGLMIFATWNDLV